MKNFFIRVIWFLFVAVGCSLSAYGQVEIEWDKTYGGDHWDELYAVVEAPDGGYLLGGTSSSSVSGDKTEGPPNVSYNQDDIWVVKTDASGNKEWDKVFSGNAYDNLRVILTTDDGGYLLGGYSNSDASGDKSEDSKGNYDIWLIKTDASGNKEWDKTIGGNAYDNLYEIVPLPDGGFLLGGTSFSDASGDKSEDGIGRGDMWIVKIDALGNIEWDKTIGSSARESLRAIEPTDDGGFLIGGSQRHEPCDPMDFGGNFHNYYVIRTDAAGNVLWDRTFGICGSDFLYDIAPAEDGGFLLGGISTSEATEGEKSEDFGGAPHLWVIRIDGSGDRQWDKAFLGHRLSSIVPSEDGGFLLGGRVNLGTGSGRDFWLIKIEETGNKLWDQAIGGDGTEEMHSMIKTVDGGYILGGYSDADISGDKSEDSRGWRDYWIVKVQEETVPEPTTGFITGGGWFHSPAGAYEQDPLAEGRAYFGFNARHKEGGESPKGNVAFILPDVRLIFHSRSIDWLAVVDESQAYIKGSGRIGREEGYHFLLSVVDQGRGFPQEKDHLRMIIWDGEENIVYDNQQGDSRYTEAGRAIERGSITIHGQEGKAHPFFGKRQQAAVSGELPQGMRAYPTQLNRQGLWLEFPAREKAAKLQLSVYDIQGRKMVSKSFNPEEQKEKQLWKLDSRDWKPGIYLLKVEGFQLNHQQKLIKEK